ncbi:MAG: FAD-dependent oxidoreductase, partial [Pseudomonadales bacterium]|nr:FAD-dependent oxidoreductase [Pseudomonadales bacterium]
MRKLFNVLRRLLLTGAVFLGITLIVAIIIVQFSGDSEFTDPTSDLLIVNDVTGLNPIRVAQVVRPVETNEIVEAIESSSGPISIGGGRYSMGGQTAFEDSLHFDMRGFNKVLKFDQSAKLITVQPGITWRDLQEYIDPYDLSVRIMQTYSNFTVGGSLSVNVHGRYVGEGPLIQSVESLNLVLSSGQELTASRAENKEIFFGVIGGYG